MSGEKPSNPEWYRERVFSEEEKAEIEIFKETIEDGIMVAIETELEEGGTEKYSVEQALDDFYGDKLNIYDTRGHEEYPRRKKLYIETLYNELKVKPKIREYMWDDIKVLVFPTEREGVFIRKYIFDDASIDIAITREIMPDEADPLAD